MQTLIILAKAPLLKKVKTRLAKDIGDEEALAFYKKILKRTCVEINLLSKKKIRLVASLTPTRTINSSLWKDYLNKDFERIAQRGETLGQVILSSMFNYLNEPSDQVILIGSDIPQIESDIIQDLFRKLKSYDLVMGPCPDGGFWSIGFSQGFFKYYPKNENLLDDIIWSSSQTREHTLRKLNRLKIFIGKKLIDVDDLNSLKKTT